MQQSPSQPEFKTRLSPRGVAGLYVGFAAFWIIASGFVLNFTIADPVLHGYLEMGKGLLFVGVTGCLLFLLVKWSHERILRLTRLYAALSQCNQAIVHSTSTTQLFPQICLDAVRFGGMRMAWVGMLDETTQLIRPVASYGEGREYLEGIRISADPNDFGGVSPAAKVFGENEPFWCQDFQREPMLAPWHARAKPFGWNSVAVLPLRLRGVPVGMFVAYFAERNAFDEAVRNLLVEMAFDISFALDNFENESARIKAEQALRDSELRYSTLFDNNSVPMILLDLNDGAIVDANARACEYYGWDRDKLRSMNVGQINLLSPDELQRTMNGVRMIGRTKLEFRHRLASGEIRDVEIFTGPVTINGRTLQLSTIIDVSDRKAAEQAARRALAMTQQFLDNLPGLAFIKDSQSRVLMANAGFGSLLGIDPVDMVGKTNGELFPREFADKINADDQRVLASGKAETLVEELGDRHFSTTKFVIDGEAGVRHLAGVTLDITERHLLSARQQALLEIHELGAAMPEKEFLRRGMAIAEKLTGSTLSFLHFVSDDQRRVETMVCSVDAESICCVNNSMTCAISENGPWLGVISDKKPCVFNDYPALVAQKGLTHGHMKVQRLLCAPVVEDGMARIVIGVGNKTSEYDDADIVSLQLIGNDLWRIARRNRVESTLKRQLSELTELNKKLEETHNQLVQSEKMAAIGQLSAGIAHEINNPISFIQANLNALSGYAKELLAIDAAYREAEEAFARGSEGVFDSVHRIKSEVGHDYIMGDVRQLIEESKEGLTRVVNIIQDLRNFSRAGEVEWQRVDLHQGLNSTLNIVRSLIRQDIDIQCEYGELPPVHCIPAQINQVFLNLIINAAQSIEGGGSIVIRTGSDGERIWVDIRDTGAGITPEHMKRLFEPFFTTKPVGQGTGLGLSLSWGIIQRHKGWIEVDSAAGRGSLFRVILPLEK